MSANVIYTYTDNTYVGHSYPFETEGVTFQYQRQLTRFFSMNVAAGPQRTFGTGASAALIPSQITPVASATSHVQPQDHKRQRVVLSRHQRRFGRGVWSADELDWGHCQQQFSRNWQGALTASYSQNTVTGNDRRIQQNYHATYGGGQVSRRLGRSFSGLFQLHGRNAERGQTL